MKLRAHQLQAVQHEEVCKCNDAGLLFDVMGPTSGTGLRLAESA